MAILTLNDMLLKSNQLASNIIVSSVLIKKLEVYGYVNSCRVENMLDIPNNQMAIVGVNGIVNKSPISEIVCSNYIYQVITVFDGKQASSIGIASPVYKSLYINEKQTKLNLEDIYVPSLFSNPTYRKIKARIGTGVVVTESMINKSGLPKNIIAEDNKAMFIAEEGMILLKNKDGIIRSVGEELLAVCRYLHPETGAMCYTQYSLDELLIDNDDDTI